MQDKLICSRDKNPISNKKDAVYTKDSIQLDDKTKTRFPILCKECFRQLVQSKLGYENKIEKENKTKANKEIVENVDSLIKFDVITDKEFEEFKVIKILRKSKWVEYFKLIVENYPEIMRFTLKDKKEADGLAIALNSNKHKFNPTYRVHKLFNQIVVEPIKNEEN